ncbi:type IV pilus biogenesis/stability protein PilW [Vibrio sp.]|nr:type IV pilus biogenesis/stability protein PilW [Vibrio sp.]
MRPIFTLSCCLLLTACVTVTDKPEPEIKVSKKEKAETRIELGLGYMRQGNMIKARENLERALYFSPEYYRAQLSMAHYFEKVGETTSAREMYEDAIDDNPKNGNVMNNFATFLCKHGEYKKADRYFNQAIDQPYYYLIAASYENAGYCSTKSGHTDKARTYFQRALDHDPNRPRSLLQLAKLEIEQGAYNDARLRLFQFQQRYGMRKPSLEMLIKLEKKAGNRALQIKYQNQLDKFLAKRANLKAS